MTSFLVVASTLPANWTPEVIKRKEGRERKRERGGHEQRSMYEKKESRGLMKRSGRPQREEKKGLKWRGHTESLWVWEKHISICNHLCSVTLLILRCDIGQYTVYTRLLQCLFKPTQRGD